MRKWINTRNIGLFGLFIWMIMNMLDVSMVPNVVRLILVNMGAVFCTCYVISFMIRRVLLKYKTYLMLFGIWITNLLVQLVNAFVYSQGFDVMQTLVITFVLGLYLLVYNYEMKPYKYKV